MPDSDNKVEAIGAESATAGALGITVVALGITVAALGITVAALEITVAALEITVAEPETEEGTVQVLGRVTGARIVEEAGEIASETEVYRREQAAVPREVPLADREAAPAAHVRAVREVRRAWGVAVVAAVAGEGGNP
jgi:hypothetical protein